MLLCELNTPRWEFTQINTFYTFHQVRRSHFIAKSPEFDLSYHSKGDLTSFEADKLVF